MSRLDRLYDENDGLRMTLSAMARRRTNPADVERIKQRLRISTEAIRIENLRLKQKRKRAA